MRYTYPRRRWFVAAAVLVLLVLGFTVHGCSVPDFTPPTPATQTPATVAYDGLTWNCAQVGAASGYMPDGQPIPLTVIMRCDTPR